MIPKVKYLNILIVFFQTTPLVYADEKPEEREEKGVSQKKARKDQIVITATRKEENLLDAPITTQLVDRREIEISGGENVADLLEQQAGVQISNNFAGDGIVLQGLDPEYTLILIDGERISGRINGVLDLSRFQVENIERVEIVKGASSSLYGSDAIAGVVNIITRELQYPFYLEAHSLFGSRRGVDVNINSGFKYEQWNGSLFGGFHRRDAFDLDTSDIGTTGSEFYRFNVGVKSAFQQNKKIKYKTRIEYSQSKSDGVDVNPSNAVFDRTNLTETLQASLGSKIDFRNSRLGVKSNYSLFRDQFLQDQRQDVEEDLLQETIDHIAEVKIKYDFLYFSKHFLTSGVDGIFEHLISDRLANETANRYRIAPYLQDEWKILEKPNLVLVPGVRGDFDSQFGNHVSPKVAVRFDPVNDKLILRASYGWGFRAPDFKQLHLSFENLGAGYVIEGNPNLIPETSQNTNAGMEYRPYSWLNLQANYFRNDLRNLIDTTLVRLGSSGSPTLYSYLNVANATTQGLESQIDFSIKSYKITLGYTFTDTLDKNTNTPLSGRANHRGSVKFTYRNEKYGLEGSIRARIVGERLFNTNQFGILQDTTTKTKPYGLLDARIAFNLNVLLKTKYTIILFIRGENLLDEGDSQFLTIAPFSVYGGLDFKFNINRE